MNDMPTKHSLNDKRPPSTKGGPAKSKDRKKGSPTSSDQHDSSSSSSSASSRSSRSYSRSPPSRSASSHSAASRSHSPARRPSSPNRRSPPTGRRRSSVAARRASPSRRRSPHRPGRRSPAAARRFSPSFRKSPPRPRYARRSPSIGRYRTSGPSYRRPPSRDSPGKLHSRHSPARRHYNSRYNSPPGDRGYANTYNRNRNETVSYYKVEHEKRMEATSPPRQELWRRGERQRETFQRRRETTDMGSKPVPSKHWTPNPEFGEGRENARSNVDDAQHDSVHPNGKFPIEIGVPNEELNGKEFEKGQAKFQNKAHDIDGKGKLEAPIPGRLTAKTRPLVDRATVAPFLLRVFLRINEEQGNDDINTREKEPVAAEVEVYAWVDTKLRELVNLVKDICEEARERNAYWKFRLIYPDRQGRDVATDIGMVHSSRIDPREDNKTLQQSKFQIGDCIDITISTSRRRNIVKIGLKTANDSNKEDATLEEEKQMDDEPQIFGQAEEKVNSQKDEADAEMAEVGPLQNEL